MSVLPKITLNFICIFIFQKSIKIFWQIMENRREYGWYRLVSYGSVTLIYSLILYKIDKKIKKSYYK